VNQEHEVRKTTGFTTKCEKSKRRQTKDLTEANEGNEGGGKV